MTLAFRAKRAVVALIGRELSNRLTAPFYDWLARRRTAHFLRSLPPRGTRLNLGCGHRPLDGWVNLDHARGPQVQVVWSVDGTLPFAAASCAVVFSEHLIEHLTKQSALRLMRECLRVLEPGGVLRLSTPDAERYLRSYAGDRSFLRGGSSGPVDSAIDRVNQVMRENGSHLWLYDGELLGVMLARAGFEGAAVRAFGESSHPLLGGVDAPERRWESLYCEAMRPGAP